MQIHKLDHINVRTSRLDEMVDWYRDVLGLKTGFRPDFPFPGAWVYIDDHATIHLVSAPDIVSNGDLKLEHFAMTASGLKGFTETLTARAIPYSLDPVPGVDIVQVNLHDPDGNHIHVDFAASEAEGL